MYSVKWLLYTVRVLLWRIGWTYSLIRTAVICRPDARWIWRDRAESSVANKLYYMLTISASYQTVDGFICTNAIERTAYDPILKDLPLYFQCGQWLTSSGTWFEHCQTHLNFLEDLPFRCDFVVFRHIFVLTGCCLDCMNDEPLPVN